jgi:type II secretory pathway component PulF
MLQRRVASWDAPLESGSLPSELVHDADEFPEVFSSLYQTGETSGKLEETLRRLHQYYREESANKMALVARWGPWLIYMGVIVFVAIRIVSGWSAYFRLIDEISQ